MEVFELILVLMACVIVSAVIDQAVSRVSLPLIQIAIGFVVALLVPAAADIRVDSELFLVLFIAPLLYDEARKSSPIALWDNKGSIVSLAIGLVIATVLVVGFALNLLVPSIPLAAAFACGAALGPTDAAAVSALGSAVNLQRRQETLLSGEALINDASGVVSFQFAIAAAVTGAFSLVDATASFALLFFGGIAAGVVFGFIARELMNFVRRLGFESTAVHVVYQIFTPFIVFLVAEKLGVSGILAVVACGLVMGSRSKRLLSAASARHRMVSDAVWDVIVLLINGVLFVLLGMQLPWALRPTIEVGFPPMFLLICILVVTACVVATRFVWVFVMELRHRSSQTGERGCENRRAAAKRALVTTVAGPKGAVTLSIIMTIPVYVESGAAFPNRELIIFITAGTILCTLLLADILLPRLAPQQEEDIEAKVAAARIKVYEGVIGELEQQMAKSTRPEYAPATRLTIGQYRARLARERLSSAQNRETIEELMQGSIDAQERCSQELLEQGVCTADEMATYRTVLSSIRGSVGYIGSDRKMGSGFHGLGAGLFVRWRRFRKRGGYDEDTARIYYKAIKVAIILEDAAIEYLNDQANSSDNGIARRHSAAVLADEHRAVRDSLRGRIKTPDGRTMQENDVVRVAAGSARARGLDAHLTSGVTDSEADSARASALQPQTGMSYAERGTQFTQQYRSARQYADEVEEGALSIELDQIRQLLERGKIDENVAHQLREDVYVLQMNLAME